MQRLLSPLRTVPHGLDPPADVAPPNRGDCPTMTRHPPLPAPDVDAPRIASKTESGYIAAHRTLQPSSELYQVTRLSLLRTDGNESPGSLPPGSVLERTPAAPRQGAAERAGGPSRSWRRRESGGITGHTPAAGLWGPPFLGAPPETPR